jgi:hypothetical protein
MTATATEPTSRPEFVDRLPAHQRHQPVRPGLDVDLRHHGVLDDVGDDPAQPVAGRGMLRALLRVIPQRPGEAGQVGAGDHAVPVLVAGGGQAATVDPPPYGVRAHAEQYRRLADPEHAHPGTLPSQMRE